MTEPPTPPRRGLADQALLLMMLPGLFWAGNAVLGRAVAGEVPPVALAFWRWTLGAAVVLPFAWRHLRADIGPLARGWPIMLVLSGLGIAVFNTLLYIAAETTEAINIVMLQTLIPVLIVALSFLLFGEKVSLRQGLGIAISLLGALTLITHGEPAELAAFSFRRGDLVMLAASLCYAGYTALLPRRPKVHGLSFIVASFALGATMLLPFYLAETLGGQPLPLTLRSLGAILYVVCFASIAAYLAFNRVVALLGANRAGLAVHMVPVFGTLLAVVLLGEVPRLYHAAGIALIGIGVWLATRRR